MSKETILLIIISITIAEFLLELVLDIMNIRNMKGELPDSLKGIYEPEKYASSLNYQRIQANFGRINSGFTFILSLVLLATGGFGWLDSYLRSFYTDPMVLGLVFFGVLFIASDILGAFHFNSMTLLL